MKIYEFVGELEMVLIIKEAKIIELTFVALELWPYNFKNKSSKFQCR